MFKSCQLENKVINLSNNNNKIDLKSQTEFIKKLLNHIKIPTSIQNWMHNDFTEKFNNIALSSNDYKRIQPKDSIGTYVYRTKKIYYIKREISFNLIGQEIEIDKIYFYARDLNETKYQLPINKCKNLGLKQFNNWKLLWNI